MKKIIMIIIIVVLTVGLLSANNDLLPLGNSKYKLSIGKIESGQIVDTALNKTINMKALVKKSLKSDVFVIGEMHTSYDCHKFQTEFIETLFKAYPKIIVGFEFFQRKDNPVLEQWRLGNLSEDEMLKKTGWFEKGSYHYNYTKMIMDLIRKYKIKVIGLNIPRRILRTTSRKGFDKLTKEEKKMFPTINVLNKDHKFLIQRIFGEFTMQMPPFWFKNMYTAQKIWDVIMAESMRIELKKNRGYKGVIIAGNNHVVYKLGIPFRYKLAKRKAKITTLIPVYVPEDKKETKGEEHPMKRMMAGSLKPIAIYSRGIGNFVFTIKASSDNYYKKFGVKGKIVDNGYMVSGVTKKSAAEKYGIKKGDIIKSVNGISIKEKGQLGHYLYKNFGKTKLTFEISKTVGIKKKSKNKMMKKMMMKK